MIVNADCIEVMKNITDGYVDGIVTDPPYLMNYWSRYKPGVAKAIVNDDNPQFIIEYAKECYRILKDHSAIFMFCPAERVGWFKDVLEDAGFHYKHIIIWVKNNWSAGDIKGGLGKQYECILLMHKGRCFRTNDYRYTDVWNFDRVAGNAQLHQNQKPVELLKRCIELYTNEGDLIFDGCMGSGSTGVAALEMGRKFIGVEIDKNYFGIAKKRLDKLSLTC